MKYLTRAAAAASLALLATPFAQAADVALGGLTWTTTGNAGLVSRTYDDPDTDPADTPDVQLGDTTPPTGNPLLGYVSTFHGGGLTDPPYLNPSPLNLVPTDDGFTQTNGSMVQSSAFTMTAADRLVLHFNYVSTDGRNFEDYAWARLVNAGTNTTAAWLFTARSGNKPDNDGTSDYINGNVLADQVGYGDLDSRDPDRKLAVTLPIVPGILGSTWWAPLGDSKGLCWDVGTSCGYTGWVTSDFQASTVKDFASGSYYLQIGVSNWGDTVFDTALAFDFNGLASQNFVNPTNVFDNAALVPEPQTGVLLLLGLAALPGLRRRAQGQR
jgi:MYXO-CTERM domain-containing protein